MNAEQLTAIIADLLDTGYQYFWLQDRDFDSEPSKAVCIPNVCSQAKKRNAEQAQNIVPYVLRRPGFYRLTTKRTQDGQAQQIVIDTRDNEAKIETVETPVTMADERTAADRRNDELTIRQLTQELGELRAEVKYLREKNAELNEELDALAADAEETAQSAMADETVSTMGQALQILPAVLDKWFSLQEQKNALMAEQIKRMNTPRPQYQQPPQNQYDEEAGYQSF